MAMPRAFAVDLSVSIFLAVALLIVFVADRSHPPEKPVPSISVIREEPKPQPPVQTLRLAVTPKQYDDMGRLLGELGSGYRYTELALDDLLDTSKLSGYDVIFLTCGGFPDNWFEDSNFGNGGRPGMTRKRVKEDVLRRCREALRAFVGRGGTLYASDWMVDVIRSSFSELFEGETLEPGVAQSVTAEVVDSGLREVLQAPTMPLRFDLNGWKTARFTPERATLYLRGEYQTMSGSRLSAPLLMKVPFQQGAIIFTSFHNEKQNSAIETRLLKFLVFAAVTARENAEAQQMMFSGGFSPQKQSLLSASPDAQSVTQTYLNSRKQRLRFALSFRNLGARLRLDVRGPSNQAYEREGDASFTIDVDAAAEGEWSYTVTALKVPFPNFAYTMTVGGG